MRKSNRLQTCRGRAGISSVEITVTLALLALVVTLQARLVDTGSQQGIGTHGQGTAEMCTATG